MYKYQIEELREKDEGENPFWISFSDMMTAIMVLFLVAMSVAMTSITEKVLVEPERHRLRIEQCMLRINAMTEKDFPGISIKNNSVIFGNKVLFLTDQHQLNLNSKTILREYTKKILEVSNSIACSGVFKRVIVEGFASQVGSYMHNLNLSLQRAERVMCILLDKNEESLLTDNDRLRIRNRFLISGASFNDLKSDQLESQRVEFKLDFLNFGEIREPIRNAPMDDNTNCPLK